MLEPVTFATYFAVMSITPGPNNIMLATSGVNFGLRRTLPHLLGISSGCALQLFISALLMSLVVSSLEGIRVWLAVIGCCYLFWLSWKLLKASAPESREVAKPMGFLAAALFQWVNPKVWVMVINSAILFMPGQPSTTSVFMLALMSAVVNFPCILVWAFGGDRLRHWLQQAWALRAFNVVMACLLALTAVWMLADEFTA
ncbi:LysE family translocator [Paludibacterium denitrificans]|uniref:LysE family translocator n=1 Tax=Paludibacterium denitrificans TaxID=2675226 RepID=A0A844GBF2_9NEIS|nr:LysE family translocator [Paludibacterium denitrificans]MTD32680.1 LysE family translocator [Paludibacterium denitrificans]HJV07200.1 LysE family translocator [Chromobacteriaceae bacterium]